MSFEDGHGPAEFQPVTVGPRGRRFDPVILGVVVAVVALALAVVKPWDLGSAASLASAAPSASTVAVAPNASPTTAPSPEPLDPLTVPPTWSDVVSAVSRRTDWGIRTIVVGSRTPPASSAASPGASPVTTSPYTERWFPAVARAGDDLAIVDEPDGSIVALGLTFPPNETPLDARIWLVHTGGELEWLDVRPVNDVPARGLYLFLRRGPDGAAMTTWAPGQYRIDVLVGGAIRRIDVFLEDRTHQLPEPDPWPVVAPPSTQFDPSTLVGRATGLFIQTDSAVTSLPAEPGPPLDEVGAWLDVDTSGGVEGPQTFVARTDQSGIVQVGVVLPSYSTVSEATVHRLAPFDDTAGTVRWTAIGSLSPISYVAFGPGHGATWRPGVYAITVRWVDSLGAHGSTWHIELRPGPLPATPLLLAATRSWAPYVGSTGVLLGVTQPLSGTDPLGVQLVDISPQTKPGYPGLSGDDLIGCGPTHVLGRPEVIGIVGATDHPLTPVAARILYPFDQGPLDILTASGSVPGLTLIAPSVTAEFGGPASYGFRAGTSRDAPGYTICIGLPAGG
jgi:hypothetical protein